MGCFLACFGGAKDRKRRRRSPRKSLPLDRAHERHRPSRPNVSTKQITSKPLTPDLLPQRPAAEVAADPLPELQKIVEHGSSRSTRKKVTFDLNVKTYEPVVAEEDTNCWSGDDEQTDTTCEERRKPQEEQYKSSPKLGAFPLNHRYQNCECSDDDDGGSECGEDEEEEDYYEDSDFDEEEDEEVGIEGNEESYDSFFSLAIDEEPKSVQEVNIPKPQTQSVQPIPFATGNARDRSQYVHLVLNPVENLSQWKEVKVRAAPAKISKKENIGTEQENQVVFFSEPTSKVKKPEGPNCSTKQEISVDASLSNWLPSSENSTVDGPQPSNSHLSNSSFSREERPILGALTIEDIKQSSVTSSPRRSPSRSPDDIPILGTVGRYWNCKNQGDDSVSSCRSGSELKGIPNTTSKYREQDNIVNWHSTPFEVMLERALEIDAA